MTEFIDRHREMLDAPPFQRAHTVLFQDIRSAMSDKGKQEALARLAEQASPGTAKLNHENLKRARLWEGFHLVKFAGAVRGRKKGGFNDHQKRLNAVLGKCGFRVGPAKDNDHYVAITHLATRDGPEIGIPDQRVLDLFDAIAIFKGESRLATLNRYLEFCEKRGYLVARFITRQEHDGKVRFVNGEGLLDTIKDLSTYLAEYTSTTLPATANNPTDTVSAMGPTTSWGPRARDVMRDQEQPSTDRQTPHSNIASYLSWLSNASGWLTIPSVLHRSAATPVEQIYAELYFLPESDLARNSAIVRDLRPAERRTSFIHADSLLIRTHSRAVIVAPPGAGKTTFIRWLCHYLLQQGEDTPIPISLRTYAAALSRDPTLGLTQFAFREAPLSEGEAASARSLVLDQDSAIRPVFLLDGWDEVPLSQRTAIRQVIDTETTRQRCFITSRPSGMPELLRAGETDFYEIGPLTDCCVSELCRNYGKTREQLPLAASLLALIEKTPALWSIAANPYLLSLFCEVVFSSGTLPDYQVCSAHWVVKNSVRLMLEDHNLHQPHNAFTDFDYEALSSIAYDLSFADDEKNTLIPGAALGLTPSAKDIGSPVAASRFVNFAHADGVQRFYAFSHLRLQEYLAATVLARSPRATDHKAIRRLLVASVWEEEVCFLGAELCQHPESTFWQVLADLLVSPDEAGELIRRAASILSRFGAADGGVSLLGLDLRDLLWQRIQEIGRFTSKDIASLLALDATYLLDQARTLLTDANGDNLEHARLLETIYRMVPFELRRTHLDPDLSRSPVYSWLVGLPARAFPSIEELEDLTEQALDRTRTPESRVFAIKQLGAARAYTSVETLISLFHDEAPDIASTAIEAASKIGGPDAAMAIAELLVQQTSPVADGMWAALNALTVAGYGVIEPHSHAYLMETAHRLDDDDPMLELVLNALEGTVVPASTDWPFRHVVERSPTPEGTAKAAVSLFKGILDPTVLSHAIGSFLDDKIRPDLRDRFVASVPFVPVGFGRYDGLWQYVMELYADAPAAIDAEHTDAQKRALYSFKLLLMLLTRTLQRFPNHPLRTPVVDFLKRSLDHMSRVESPLSGSLLLAAEVAATDANVFELLIGIASGTSVSIDHRKSAMIALRSATDLLAEEPSFPALARHCLYGRHDTADLPLAFITSFPDLAIMEGAKLVFWKGTDNPNIPVLQELLVDTANSRGCLYLTDRLIDSYGLSVTGTMPTAKAN